MADFVALPGNSSPKSSLSDHPVGRTILNLGDQWLEEYLDWDEDCATVAKLYSGSVVETPEDQETLGLVDHSNYLIGRSTLARAKEEAYAAFTQVRQLMSFKLQDYGGGPASDKVRQEALFSKEVDNYVRNIDPVFMDECLKMCDRHVMHGDAVMMLPPRSEGWRPVSGKILTDLDAPQNPSDDNFTRWAVMADIQVSEVMDAIKEEREGWTAHAGRWLETEWKLRYKGIEEGTLSTYYDKAFDLFCSISPEEWEAHGQTGRCLRDFVTHRMKGYHFFQKDFSADKGVPVDLYIVARFRSREDLTGDPLLYKRKAVYADVRECLYEFVLDGNLGVIDPSWGTIKGLGHVNYNPDRMTNLLLSVLQNSAVDKATPLWEALNVTDHKLLEKWIKSGYKAHSVVPSGMQMVDKSKSGPPIGEVIELIRFHQVQANENAVGQLKQSEPRQDELRVNALERQLRDQRTANNRGVIFWRKLNALFREVGQRLVAEIHESSYFGEQKAEIKALKQRLLAQQVELEWFYPENVTVSYTRLTGDGDPQMRLAISEQLMARIAFIPEAERGNVFKEWYAALTGNWERAEEIYGDDSQATADQTVLAMQKGAAMTVLGAPMPVTADDIPELQLPVILSLLQNLVVKGVDNGGFEPDDARGFIALGQYATQLILQLETFGRKQVAKVFQDQLQQVSRRAQEPFNNMAARQQAQEEEGSVDDQLKRARFQLDTRRVELEEQRLASAQQTDHEKGAMAARRQNFNEYADTKRLLDQEGRIDLEKLRLELEILRAQEQRDIQRQP